MPKRHSNKSLYNKKSEKNNDNNPQFAYMYLPSSNAPTTAVSVVPFSNNDEITDKIVHQTNENTEQIRILESGIYEVLYYVQAASAIGTYVELKLNSDNKGPIPVNGSRYLFVGGVAIGQVKFCIPCGSILTLESNNVLTFNTSLGAVVDASLDIKRLSDVLEHNTCC